MKFYRVHYRKLDRESVGFEWFAHPRQAEVARETRRAEGHEDEPDGVELINITATKVGMLAALNHYASHPDNG